MITVNEADNKFFIITYRTGTETLKQQKKLAVIIRLVSCDRRVMNHFARTLPHCACLWGGLFCFCLHK